MRWICLALAFGATSLSAQSAPTKPNFVFIFADRVSRKVTPPAPVPEPARAVLVGFEQAVREMRDLLQ